MRLRLCFLFLAAIVASACSDDYVPPPSTGGTSGSGGTAGTSGTAGTNGTAGTGGMGGMGTGGMGTGGMGTGGTAGTAGSGGNAGSGGTGGSGGAAPMGACDNQNDVAVLASLQPTNARQIAANCGLTRCGELVTVEAPFKACVDDCIMESVAGLSAECTRCYDDLAWCSRVLCAPPCATNACTPLCLSCTGYDTCVAILSDCAGRDSIDCPGDT